MGQSAETNKVKINATTICSCLFTFLLCGAVCLVYGVTSLEVVASEQSGKALYQSYCAACHGENLQGARGPSLVDDEWRHEGDRESIQKAIQEGIVAKGMPGFNNLLTATQINQLIDFINAAPRASRSQTAATSQTLETLDYRVEVTVVADGLEVPWGIAFLDEQNWLVTERPGRLRLISKGRMMPEPVSGIPSVHYPDATQGGLLDVVLDPDYGENGWIYLSYSHALTQQAGEENAPSMLRVVRGRIRDHQWVDQQLIFDVPRQAYPNTPPYHYGGRLLFDNEGYLYISVGDRYAFDPAQDLQAGHGKIHRINPDGSIPPDNPFIQTKNALPSIFSLGHRNPQGMALHPQSGKVWAAEHGPMGGDELNLIHRGANYGWPVISYGINYDGTELTPHRRRDGMEQPRLYWRPSIAVSGIAFYTGNLFPRWHNKLLVAALKNEELRLLDMDGDHVMHQEILMEGQGQVRDVTTGQDGAIYVLMHNPGKVLRLTPK